jgi:hypothetical protein
MARNDYLLVTIKFPYTYSTTIVASVHFHWLDRKHRSHLSFTPVYVMFCIWRLLIPESRTLHFIVFGKNKVHRFPFPL